MRAADISAVRSKYKGNFMKIRLISGAVYVAILLASFALKIFVHDLCFDLLTYAFALLGTFELLRATKDKTTTAQRAIVYIFAALTIPACALAEYFFAYGLHIASVCFFATSVALVCLLVVRHNETTLENLGISFFTMVYPTLLLCLLILVNHVPALPKMQEVAFNSDVLILLIFVVSPVADSLAYVFGRFLRKFFPKKLAPILSPNKTVIGGIGGLFGGVLGAGIVYVIYNATVGSFANVGLWLPVYLIIGLVAAAATAFGDLVESCIKRKLGIKDMGKIMPGHGGVLDRIDGTLFATMVVYLAFALLRICL